MVCNSVIMSPVFHGSFGVQCQWPYVWWATKAAPIQNAFSSFLGWMSWTMISWLHDHTCSWAPCCVKSNIIYVDMSLYVMKMFNLFCICSSGLVCYIDWCHLTSASAFDDHRWLSYIMVWPVHFHNLGLHLLHLCCVLSCIVYVTWVKMWQD